MKRLPLSDLSRFLSKSTFQAQSPTSDKFFTPCLSTISQLNLDSLHINLLEYIAFSYLMKYLFSSTLFPKRFFLLLFNLNIGNQLLLVVPTFWARKVQTVNVLFSWCWCSFSTFISESFYTYLRVLSLNRPYHYYYYVMIVEYFQLWDSLAGRGSG